MRATYSPEDNKLRLYSDERLDAELYARVRKAGFIWAAKQGLFVAPMWTPSREDLLIELCGEIEDEDTSLVDRAAERAERFGEYSDHRAEDAERAKDAVSSLAGNIPFGQPILVGHHSERRARKDAEKIENGMRKAVKMWETSKYWEDRAKGALRHAKYKERPDVRARRIKGLEADLRKQEKEKKSSEMFLKLWESIQDDSIIKQKDGTPGTTQGRAKFISNRDDISAYFPLDKYPRELPASQYEGMMDLYSALDGIITPEQAQKIAIDTHSRTIRSRTRWINHTTNRLTYEKAMLEEAGAGHLIEKKPRPTQLPLCNYRAPEGIRIENIYHKGEFSIYPQVEMTKAEYMAVYKDRRGCETVDNSHRVRTLYRVRVGELSRQVVFLTDSKVTDKPEPIERKETAPRPTYNAPAYVPPEKTDFDAMKETLKEGIKTVCAPQLFPTPPEIAGKMVEYADIQTGQRILEPSAGTGNLIKAIEATETRTDIIAVELNNILAQLLRDGNGHGWGIDEIVQGDFLDQNGNLGKFDRIIMNPPFENAVDIKHIQHAQKFLKPGGRLVALCANGSRQRAAFMDIAEYWEDLPEGSFKAQGTGVNVALMVLTN